MIRDLTLLAFFCYNVTIGFALPFPAYAGVFPRDLTINFQDTAFPRVCGGVSHTN